MQKSTLWFGRKLSLCLLLVAAVVVATPSAHAWLVGVVPENSAGSAELIAVVAMVGVALILRRKPAKK